MKLEIKLHSFIEGSSKSFLRNIYELDCYYLYSSTFVRNESFTSRTVSLELTHTSEERWEMH